MARKIKVISGISEWIRKSVGTDAENRGEEASDEREPPDEDAEDEDGSRNNSPVCCSAASNSDLTVLDA